MIYLAKPKTSSLLDCFGNVFAFYFNINVRNNECCEGLAVIHNISIPAIMIEVMLTHLQIHFNIYTRIRQHWSRHGPVAEIDNNNNTLQNPMITYKEVKVKYICFAENNLACKESYFPSGNPCPQSYLQHQSGWEWKITAPLPYNLHCR